MGYLCSPLCFLHTAIHISSLWHCGHPYIPLRFWKMFVSYDDAIFAMQEVIVKYVHDSSSVFRCLHDIQKVFDSVMYCVLLERLFSVGVSGKCGGCCVLGMTILRCRVCTLLPDFCVERGLYFVPYIVLYL